MFRQMVFAAFAFLALIVPASALDLIDFIPASDRAQLTTGCVTADSYWAQAVAVLGAKGGDIALPVGCLFFAHTIDLKTRLNIRGQDGGQAGEPVSKLVFAPNTEGIVVHRYDTGPGNVVLNPPTSPADGSIIEGVSLYGSGTVGNGIRLHARATIQQVTVQGFGENCINIEASSGPPSGHGNANNWVVNVVRLTGCGGSGLRIQGADTNAGISTMVDAEGNHRYGIEDNSFLGNLHNQPLTADNWLGGYRVSNANARTTFVNPYAEGGQPPSLMTPLTTVIGGMQNPGMTGGPMVIAGGVITPFSVTSNNGTRDLTVEVQKTTDSGGVLSVKAAGEAHGLQLAYWNEALKTWEVRYEHAGPIVFGVTTNMSTMLTDEAGVPIGAGKMIIDGLYAWTGAGLTFRRIPLKEQDDRIRSLEARITALEALH